jgi:DNA-binding GntR family transcriptional regulator
MTASTLVPPALSGPAKHATVARALASDITSGKYPVGTQLPPENELAVALGVSRQTLRAALRHLRDLGLVVGSQGIGNFVRASAPTTAYSYAFDSINDLLQYAADSEVRVLSRRELTLTEAQAVWLGRREGEVWWEVRTLRTARTDGAPVAYSSIAVPYVAGDAIQQIGTSNKTLFSLIEHKLGERITEIVQNLSVAHVNDLEAESLGVTPGSAVMCAERRYFGRSGDLLEVSRSLHPADRFRYGMRVRVQTGSSAR